MAAIDILTYDPDDAAGMAALVAIIRRHLSPEERAHFDEDLERWNARYTRAISELVSSPEWQEVEQWRAYILRVAAKTRVA